MVFLAVGAVIGLIYFSRWSGRDEETPISQDARITDLRYILGVGAIASISDIMRSQHSASSEYFLQLSSFYAEGVVGMIIMLFALAFFGMTIRSIIVWKRIRDHEFDSPFHPFLEFVKYGYERYKDCWIPKGDKLRLLADEYFEFRGRALSIAKMISLDFASIERYNENPTEQHRTELTQLILRQICGVARAYMADDDSANVRSNIMLAHPMEQITDEQRRRLKFHSWGDPRRYTHILDLRYYDSGRPLVALALAAQDRGIDGANKWSLPGAPQAFLFQNKVVVVDVSDVRFPIELPAEIQTEIQQFLSSQGFRIFVSYPMTAGDCVNGVINIESNHDSIASADESVVEEFGRVLQPFGLLLGSLHKAR